MESRPAERPLKEVLEELGQIAGDAPFLALGQTVFWDEPMKAGVALAARRLGLPRRLVAGVHDTDYFAKLPSGPRQPGAFRTLPHNDTTTRGLWSAAGEFSALFGSETVVTRDLLSAASVKMSRLAAARPNFLDEATEAFHWRGIVSLDEHAPITADVSISQLLPELRRAFAWALDASTSLLTGDSRASAEDLADELKTMLCDTAADHEGGTVGDLYEALLGPMYEFAAGLPVPMETARTSQLLRFDAETCGLPRFDLLDLFANSETRPAACAAYDAAIAEADGLYPLARFGTGAIPFDAILPKHGRGTIRLGHRGAVIMTAKPQFLSFETPLRSGRDLAERLARRFGPNVVVVGKAVALIGMLAREFVFVFHEGASGYVRHSRRFHQLLAAAGHVMPLHPILRIRYDAWSAMQVCCSWLKLPDPLVRPFGTEEVCAPSFAARWKEVSAEQSRVIEKLGELRRPVDLLNFLDAQLGGSWRALAAEYGALREKLSELERDLAEIRTLRHTVYERLRSLRLERVAAERNMGEHWRARIFERDASQADWEERRELEAKVRSLQHARQEAESQMHDLRRRQNARVADPEVQRIHARRQSIELEAELKRVRLVRSAVVASRGLANANRRPSAWWFRLVCPDGLWFRETVDQAGYYLEPLN